MGHDSRLHTSSVNDFHMMVGFAEGVVGGWIAVAVPAACSANGLILEVTVAEELLLHNANEVGRHVVIIAHDRPNIPCRFGCAGRGVEAPRGTLPRMLRLHGRWVYIAPGAHRLAGEVGFMGLLRAGVSGTVSRGHRALWSGWLDSKCS